MERRAVLATITTLSAGCLGVVAPGDECPAVPRDGTTVCRSDADLSVRLSPDPVEPNGELTVTIRNESNRVFEYDDQDPYSIFEKFDSEWVAVAPRFHRQAYSARKVETDDRFTVDLSELAFEERGRPKPGRYVFCLTGRLLSSDGSDSSLYHVLERFEIG